MPPMKKRYEIYMIKSFQMMHIQHSQKGTSDLLSWTTSCDGVTVLMHSYNAKSL
jgi:hypothetical protein